jgi:HD-GYP domain-containing protein (c-di-GMP phosphodiesterase class II)
MGYPYGLAGEQIPLEARIFSIADTVDAITSDRPYRNGKSFEEARREVERHSGSQFDPQLVEVFLSIPQESWTP